MKVREEKQESGRDIELGKRRRGVHGGKAVVRHGINRTVKLLCS